MRSIRINLRSQSLSRIFCLFFTLAAVLALNFAAQAQATFDFNASRNPQFLVWGPNVSAVGWYITPNVSLNLTRIETNFNPVMQSGSQDRNVTIEILTDRRAAGGTLLRSVVFNSSTARGQLGGGSFTPIALTAGTTYFIGFRNVGGIGINTTNDAGAVNCGACVYADTETSVEGQYQIRFGDNTPSVIDQPILRLIGAPQPSPTPTPTPTPTPDPPPTLGTYADTSLVLSSNTVIMPSAAPTNATSINISTNSNFQGTFAANPATGVVTVTDAHPAGVYAVTVRAFGTGVAATRTFTLTVTNGVACTGISGFTSPAVPDITLAAVNGSVALGDFNGDGIQDFAVPGTTTNTTIPDIVSIRLGNGAGGFTLPATPQVNVGNSPNSIAIGDFNGDGRIDFVTANSNSNNVSIRLGDGTGGFTSPPVPEVAVGNSPFSIAVGDFNGDGRLDFATANLNSNNISIRLGNGAGGFTSPSVPEVAVGIVPSSVAIGDFNGDGIQDFAAANFGTFTGESTTVSIRLGNGAGGFISPAVPEVTVGNSPSSVTIGDFNGDGIQDIGAPFFGGVAIRLGDGLGGFVLPDEIEPNVAATFLTIGDFNGDGIQDFLAADSNFRSNTVKIRLGDGIGGFITPPTPDITVRTGPAAAAIGDFNGDGRQDFVVANQSNNSVSVRLGTCAPAPPPSPTPTPLAVITAEVEPNNTPATAQPLNLSGQNYAIVTGQINPAADVDFYRIDGAAAGSKINILVDTGGPLGTGAGTVDSLVDLIAADGTTIIETDDDDGTGNGGDGTIENQVSSLIAGRTLTAGGTYYIRVRAFAPNRILNPYRLFVVVTPGNLPIPEVEGNDTPATANAIVTAATATGVRTAALSNPADVDYYSVAAKAGSTLFIAADGDPERDGNNTNIVVDLFAPDGTTLLLQMDGASDTSPAEGADFNVPADGLYYVFVRRFNGAPLGTYNLMVTACGRPTASAVSVSGRVFTPDGHGLKSASVSLTDSNSTRRSVTTNSFGSYQFDAVTTGMTYTIGVSSKRFRFSQQMLAVNGNLTNIDFTGLE